MTPCPEAKTERRRICSPRRGAVRWQAALAVFSGRYGDRDEPRMFPTRMALPVVLVAGLDSGYRVRAVIGDVGVLQRSLTTGPTLRGRNPRDVISS